MSSSQMRYFPIHTPIIYPSQSSKHGEEGSCAVDHHWCCADHNTIKMVLRRPLLAERKLRETVKGNDFFLRHALFLLALSLLGHFTTRVRGRNRFLLILKRANCILDNADDNQRSSDRTHSARETERE